MNYAYQGRNPPSHLVAMNASYGLASNNPNLWFTDSGASSHMTNDLANLDISNEYTGSDDTAIANGQGLNISHIGSSSLHTNSHSFGLKNVLCVPSHSSNLLSVHKICVDNNYKCVFDSQMLEIQDLKTGKTLYRGPCHNGLYPIQVSSSHSNPNILCNSSPSA